MSLRPLLVLPCCLAASAQDGQFAVSLAKAAPSVLQPTDASLRGAPYLDPKRPLEQRVEDLFARLKPEEKVALIHGSGGFADFAGLPRLGLPTLVMTDGPQGVRTSVPTTGFPSGIALAATWRPELAERVGQVLGRETRATGHSVLLGPGMNLLRTPLAGRNFEYFGEDPLVAGRTAAAYVRGVQSQGVAACVKHVALNDQEAWRLGVSAEADERTLRELHGRAFEIAIREGRPWSAMPAYNRVSGAYCAQNPFLLRTLFRGDYGFDGCFISDWGAWGETPAALAGGCDLEMPADRDAERDRTELGQVASGAIRTADLDGATRNVLRLLFRVGAFDPPRPPAARLAADTAPLARRMAQEAAVLLKNEGLLPFEGGKLKHILVVGPNADRRHSMRLGGDELLKAGGSGAILPPYELTALEAFRERLGTRVTTWTSTLDGGRLDTEGLTRAAREADAVVFIGGLTHADDHEGNCPPAPDRRNLDLPGRQPELIRTLVDANPRTVVVLQGGSPMSLEGWCEAVPAIVMAWYPGQEGARALVDVLLGKAEPGGRLPFTLGKRLEDWRVHRLGPEAYPGLAPARTFDPKALKQVAPEGAKVFYREGMALGYRGFEADGVAPRYPFGHGLSYATFRQGPAQAVAAGGVVTLTLSLTNTSRRAGSEVIQVYACPPREAQHLPESRRPFRGLVAYQKVDLAAGASTTVHLTVTPADLRHWDPDTKAWKVLPGEWTLDVGRSSSDVQQRVPVRF